jgi:Family of unknown function (DUF5677)
MRTCVMIGTEVQAARGSQQMTDDGISIDEVWPKAYEVDWDGLKAAKSEDDFGEAAFELLKEAGILAHIAASLMPRPPLKRNEAIVSALILKASKLAKAVVAMTAHLGSDRQLALLRELIEALATLHYLLGDPGEGSRFDQYVDDSLVAEREFLRTINANIQRRNATWAIEESMMRSIRRTAAAAGIEDVDSLPGRARIGWPRVEDLLKGLGENVYPAYRSGSSVLHTKWADILRNHLKRREDGLFELRFEDMRPRPQPLYAAGTLLVIATKGYLADRRPDAMEQFDPALDSLYQRLDRLGEVHGSWLDDLDAAD